MDQPFFPGGVSAPARGHWLSAETLAWDSPALRDAARVTLGAAAEGVAAPVVLAPPVPLPEALRERFPHLAHYAALGFPGGRRAEIPRLVQGPLALSAVSSDGAVLDATGVQLPGVLDDLFRYDGPLGVSLEDGCPTLRVWAPTALRVDLALFPGPRGEQRASVPMERDDRGVWSARGGRDWSGLYYLYEVTVFAPETGRVETNAVTDPCSVCLACDGARSQILDLADPALAPPGWPPPLPPLERVEDAVVYELHVRDFSIGAPDVPPEHRGRFLAFTHPGSRGMAHLRSLAEAGVTHVQLLPVFDFATVPERLEDRAEPEADLDAWPTDSDRQQAAVAAVRKRDGFNWGYDPVHCMAPEGSYATDPDGPSRVVELRSLVAALARTGLRVVMDVVFNHTFASGQHPRSVLDRIVPGYYHRTDADGVVLRSSCCPNTASEHAMMEKLMVDAALLWARHYRIAGFRFDLMGHHLLRNVERVRDALGQLSPERDGVDGSRLLLYGEGWSFAEMAHRGRGRNAAQGELAGSGVGSFNDRLRDAVRGGGAFDGPREQGLATGLADHPYGHTAGSSEEQRARWHAAADAARISLGGNLGDLGFRDRHGKWTSGARTEWRGQWAGYAGSPRETVNYVSAHDNETLFDAIQMKAPADADLDERVRMQNLALSFVLLGQGIPFLHAGCELLRSKSLDRNSYDSGDHFNRLDWSGRSANWGVGLPPAWSNAERWPELAPLLAEPGLRPGPAQIARCREHVLELLRIRSSSRLFRLDSGEAVARHVAFPRPEGPDAEGLIPMLLGDPEGSIEPVFRALLVLFNTSRATRAVRVPEAAGFLFSLHPEQAGSSDPRLREVDRDGDLFRVPGRTAAVLAAPRGAPEP
jgi:pullulanase-type alpha-1,6-glucosidase